MAETVDTLRQPKRIVGGPIIEIHEEHFADTAVKGEFNEPKNPNSIRAASMGRRLKEEIIIAERKVHGSLINSAPHSRFYFFLLPGLEAIFFF